MDKKRKICFFTGTRAEYGLLRPVIEECIKLGNCQVQILVSGAHLSPEFGNTFQEIEKDGFSISAKVEIILSSDSPIAVCKSMSLGIIGIAEKLEILDPDILVILGDRYEALSAAISATLLGIPIAHIAGGEVTSGAVDEVFRHSITKMSHLHFASTEDYKKRIIQLGEDPGRVFWVGSTSIDNLRAIEIKSKEQMHKEIGIVFKKTNYLVTYHPQTISDDDVGASFETVLSALKEIEDVSIIFTKANADVDGRKINLMIDDFVNIHPNSQVYDSLGTKNYLSLLSNVDCVIGNSSSGIIEAPSFNVPTVNIGNRQDGRIKAISIIDCIHDKNEIKEAILKASAKDFRESINNTVNPYDKGEAAKEIAFKLVDFELSKIRFKKFFDLPGN